MDARPDDKPEERVRALITTALKSFKAAIDAIPELPDE